LPGVDSIAGKVRLSSPQRLNPEKYFSKKERKKKEKKKKKNIRSTKKSSCPIEIEGYAKKY
jgi:hypothetical protein